MSTFWVHLDFQKQVAHLQEVQTLFIENMLKKNIYYKKEKQLENMPIPNCYDDVM